MSRKRVQVKLSEWAERNGIPLRTAQRRVNDGTIGVPVTITATGRILVTVDADGWIRGSREHETEASLRNQVEDLQQQVAELTRRLRSIEGRKSG